VRHPVAALEYETPAEDAGLRLQRALFGDPRRFTEFASVYRSVVDGAVGDAELRARLLDPYLLADCLLDLMAALPFDEWRALTAAPPTALSLEPAAGADGTLAIVASGRQRADETLRDAAALKFGEGAQVVVMGHTHQPDRIVDGDRRYFNPGSWTRYVDSASIGLLTLEDLKDEADFPYQLNYVRVEAGASGALGAEMIPFEERTGFRFGQRLRLT
jgi:hypothetical protein